LSGSAVVFGASGGIGAALVAQLAASGDHARVHAGARRPPAPSPGIAPFAFDLEDEASIAAAAQAIAAEGPPALVIVATWVLSAPGGPGPEKSWRAIDPAAMARLFALNTIGPATIARHFLPLLPREGRCVFAALSARVGSIGDNALGGWHSYRASKAALNMLVRNFAIELAARNRDAIAVALHPGTVDTALSRPFQRGVPAERLFAPEVSAAHLLRVIEGLGPSDSGGLFAWDGQRIPY
jgi:NAD(P)-dependent dehydrogenase (short-subunit alcohol dehydrogenase family)